MECDEYDLDNGEHQDLLDDVVWDVIIQRLKEGYYDFLAAGPPCETFSHSRYNQPGPRPLRSVKEPYGFKNLKGFEAEQVRKANLFAARTAEACTILLSQPYTGFMVENPAPWDNCPSLWILDEYKILRSQPDVKYSEFDQCTVGAVSTKPTGLLTKGINVDAAGLAFFKRRCDHPAQWHDVDGQWHWGSHPRQIRRKDKSGKWLTKRLAKWPSLFNHAVALLVKEAKNKQKLWALKRKFDDSIATHTRVPKLQ